MGNRRLKNQKICPTQVTPSAQAVIKTVIQRGHLWSSTIATSVWLIPWRPAPPWHFL